MPFNSNEIILLSGEELQENSESTHKVADELHLEIDVAATFSELKESSRHTVPATRYPILLQYIGGS